MAVSWQRLLRLADRTGAHWRGRAAERGACRYLQRRGLHLIQRNFRTRGGEIDLVMEQGDTIVFVEVRLRCRTEWGSAAESIGVAKRRRLARAAAAYLATGAHGGGARGARGGARGARGSARPARFDAVLVTQPHFRLRYEWIRDAFTP
jgi:putative endonuclease